MLLAADSGSLETLAAELCREGLPPPRVAAAAEARVAAWHSVRAHAHTLRLAAQPPCHVTKATQAQQRRELKVFLAAGSFFARLSLCSV